MTLASSFLAGSILSLLLPTVMFVLLAVWYVKFVRRVPETTDRSKAEPSGSAPADAAAPHGED